MTSIRAGLIVVACVALALWAWPIWLRFRTEQTVRLWASYRISIRPRTNRPSVRSCPSAAAGLRSRRWWRRCGATTRACGLRPRRLGAIGPDAAAAFPALIALCDESDLYVRQTVPQALGAIGPAAKSALPAPTRAMRQALAHQDQSC